MVRAIGVAAMVFAAASARGARAEGTKVEQTRTISVAGEAELKVVPDEVILTLGVESLNKDLGVAKKDNDERTRKVLAAARAGGLGDKQLQTDHVSIEPTWDYVDGRRTFLGYLVRRNMALTLRDLTKFEALLSGALDQGANYVHGVQFLTTKLREHRDAARAAAAKAAREKAAALAAELGAKLGRPLTINESGGGWLSSYGWWAQERGRGMTQNVMQIQSGPAAETGGPTAPGMISVHAQSR